VKPRGRREPRRLGAVITGVLGDLGLDEASAIVKVAERWEAAVGADVAAHCRPSALRGSVLEATVDSSVWCQQLQLQSRAILAGLRRELGDDAPSELRLFVG
jgi:predicted nucleic acid-binding Zn ribbon protein